MFTSSPTCDTRRLRQLLDGQLKGRAETETTLHLDSCVDCQNTLESLAAGTPWWQETRELLGESTRQWTTEAGASDANDLEASDPPRLDFLSPSDNPAMLGRLGEFEILEYIGRGGMGLVLKGYDHELNRFVAIKVLAPHLAEYAVARRRFAREAQAAAAVVHQHVVAIHAVDGNHRPPYLVMPYIPGESLQQRLDRTGPFEVEEVLRIGQQVAEGLAAAHAQGLIHRDIKPANILLERNVERVLLTDFGLARAIDDVSLSQSGVLAGTPQYMSPEQGRDEALDHRTDLFSLGSVLYALLAGHPPFRAKSAYAAIRRVNEETPRSLREINARVPAWLEMLIGKLLAKHPDERWQSASQVAALLKDCLAHIQQPHLVSLPQEVATPRADLRRHVLRIVIPLAVGLVSIAWLWSIVGQNPAGVREPGNEMSQQPAAPQLDPRPPFGVFNAADSNLAWPDPLPESIDQVDKQLKSLETEPEF